MSSKSSSVILITVVLSAVIGGILGYYLPNLMLALSFIGQLWINALNILVIPLVAASIIVAVAAIGHAKKVTRSVRNMIVYFASTSAIAVVIGLLAVLIIHPGAVTSSNGAFIPDGITQISSLSTSGVIGSILPNNFILATAQGQLLGLFAASLLFGIVLAAMDAKKSKPVLSFVTGFNDVIARMVNYAVYAAPIGVLFLLGGAVAKDGVSLSKVAGSLGALSLTLVLAFLLHGLVILPLATKFYARRRPFKFLGNLLPAITTAFASGSSVATLPVTFENVVDDAEVDRRAGSLTLPLGAMINTNGTALFLAVATVFIAQVFGIDVSPLQILVIGMMSLLVSFAASLVPGISLLMLAIVIKVAGFSANAFAGIGLILVVDWFWLRWRAALNVWGDAVGAAVISETFEFKTARSTPPNPPMRRGFGKSPFSRKERSDDRKSDRKRERPQTKTSTRRTREHAATPTAASSSSTEERGTRRERQPRQRRTRSDSRTRTDSRPRHEKTHREERPREEHAHSQDEKPFKYTLPPVPFHVLQGELAGRKKTPHQPPAEDKPAPETDVASAARPDALSQDSLEHERARIAAQLASMRGGGSQETHEQARTMEVDSSEKETSELKEHDTADEPKVQEQRHESHRKESHHDKEHHEEVSRPKHEHEPVEQQEKAPSSHDEPAHTEEESEKEVSYGRARSRRGQQFKKERQSSNESESDQTDGDADEKKEPAYSTEGASFGRSKRKKQ